MFPFRAAVSALKYFEVPDIAGTSVCAVVLVEPVSKYGVLIAGYLRDCCSKRRGHNQRSPKHILRTLLEIEMGRQMFI